MKPRFQPIPHIAPPAWPLPPHEPRPGRMAHAILRNAPEMVEDRSLQGEIDKCRVALFGLPDDLGVELNHGRTGAAQGPGAFRAALSRYGVAEPSGWEWPRVFDVGNVIPAPGNDAAALAQTHDRVTAAVRSVLEQTDGRLFPIAVGGGHDLTFPFVRGVIEFWSARAVKIRDGVYFDAHLDVRPPEPPGSGMPFRALVEHCGVERLGVFGHSPLANSREHVEWFEDHGGRFAHELELPEPAFASFDLDVLDAAHAPGVSALNPCGWSVLEAEMFVEQLGASPMLRCFDIMELNPSHDEQGRTARVAAHLFLMFLKGLATRTGGGENRA